MPDRRGACRRAEHPEGIARSLPACRSQPLKLIRLEERFRPGSGACHGFRWMARRRTR